MCSHCDKHDPTNPDSSKQTRGLCRHQSGEPGAYSVKAMHNAGTPQRVAFLKSLGIDRRVKRCSKSDGTGTKQVCRCTWCNLVWGEQHFVSKSHFQVKVRADGGHLRVTKGRGVGLTPALSLCSDAVADVPYADIWANNKQRRSQAAAAAAVLEANTTREQLETPAKTCRSAQRTSPRGNAFVASPASPERHVWACDAARVAENKEAAKVKSAATHAQMQDTIEELKRETENNKLKQLELDAPMSVHALKTDPFVRAAVRQYTGFYTTKAFDAWLALMNANGRMSLVNPSKAAHPTLGHDAGLYTNDEHPVRPGVWCETTFRLELNPDQTDAGLLDLEADTLVQVTSPPEFSGEPQAAPADGEEDYVWVQTADGKDRGKVPRGSLTPLDQSQAATAKAYQHLSGRHRACSWENALFFVLYCLRTGSDKKDAAPLFHLRYSTAARYFVVYLQALKCVLASEFPYPSEEMIRMATPPAFQKHFPGRTIQEIIDAHEQEMEVPSCLVARRSTWSSYKHRNTAKFLGGCTPCGAMVTASEPRGGSCVDRGLTRCSGLLYRLYKGCSTLADKGFLMHADFAEFLHELITPCKAYNKQATFTVDETLITTQVARDRALVERVFRRGQEWKYLHRRIPISECDLAGSVFFVIMMMTNYEPLAVRQKDEPLTSLAEKQWPTDSYK